MWDNLSDPFLEKEPILTAGKLGRGFSDLSAAGISADYCAEFLYLADLGNKRI